MDVLETQFMQEALNEAKKAYGVDEVPIGVVIVENDKIIARAHNCVERDKNALKHAEIEALNQAMLAKQSKWLYGCDVYVTAEPCAMCAGAMILARIKRLIIGCRNFKMGACGTVLDVLNCQKLNHKIEVIFIEDSEQYTTLLQRFFKEKRL